MIDEDIEDLSEYISGVIEIALKCFPDFTEEDLKKLMNGEVRI